MATKNYKGAPFGTQTARFNVSGIHPQSKTPGTFTQVPYCTKSLTWAGLAPGCYNIDVRDTFNKKVVKIKSSGPGWERQYKVAQLAKLPHLLHRQEAQRREERIRRLGPGTYNHEDFVQKITQKPSSIRGICATKDSRFRSKDAKVPGPGTYGSGGIPSAAMEKRSKQSSSTVGMLDSGWLKREIPLVGCELAPTRYNKTGFTEQILNKVVSKRGPYDCFTGSRSKPIMTGHLSVNPASQILGPGSYNLPNFTDDWNTEWRNKHGKFSKLYMEASSNVHSKPAGERIHCCTLSQCPRSEKEPGPGNYSPKVFSINLAEAKENSPAFGTSANRYRQEIKSNNVGAGRYNITNSGSCTNKKTNGAKWVFHSSTNRFENDARKMYLKERIRTKDMMLKERIPLV